MDDKLFRKRAIIVTGASSGIGKAISIKLVELGYQVFGLARSYDKLVTLFSYSADDRPSKVNAKAKENEAHFVPIECDITEPKTFDNIIDKIISKATGNMVYGLVNNAGYVEPGAIEDLDMNNLRSQFETNFFGLVGFTKKVLPVMMQQRKEEQGEAEGRIVNVSSVSGLISLPLIGAYSATKYALEAVSDALRMELWNTSIKVITINPGIIETNISNTLQRKTQDLINTNKQSRFVGAYNKYFAKRKYSGLKSSVVADVVCHVLSAPNPKHKYVIGSNKEKIAVKLRPFVPDNLFYSLLVKRIHKHCTIEVGSFFVSKRVNSRF
jgi:short-subunit dehydrogenase